MQGYGREADLWSVGVIMFLLLCGKLPFDGEDHNEIIRSTIQVRTLTLMRLTVTVTVCCVTLRVFCLCLALENQSNRTCIFVHTQYHTCRRT